jgi:hypothetical protein
MVIGMKEIQPSTGADFVFSEDNNPILYHARIKLGTNSPDIDLIRKEEQILSLSSDEVPSDIMSVFSREKILSYIKKPNGDICGEVSLKVARKFIASYKYIQINYNAELINCYEVRTGKEEVFICLYLGNVQIAMIEKSSVIHDNKEYFRIYIKNDKYAEIVCLYAVYYDYLTLRSNNEILSNASKEKCEITQNRDLKSKYNPNFKEGC